MNILRLISPILVYCSCYLGKNLTRFNCDYRAFDVNLEEIRCSHILFRNIRLIPLMSTDIIRLVFKIKVHKCDFDRYLCE